MPQQLPHAQAAPSYEPPSRLPERRRSWYVKELAHTFAAGSQEGRGRFLGLLVVILTTIISTGTFTALQNNPSQAAKVATAVLAVIAAIAAAMKEFFQYGKTSADHLAEAAKYESFKNQADDLADKLTAHAIEWADADKALTTLEGLAETQDKTPPMVYGHPYNKGVKWVRDAEERRAKELQAAL